LLFLVIFEAGRYYNISDVQKIVGLLKRKFTKNNGEGGFHGVSKQNMENKYRTLSDVNLPEFCAKSRHFKSI
jgi:hypothetical protein